LTAAGVNPEEIAGVRSGTDADVRLAATSGGGAAVEGSNISSPQVAVTTTDLQSGTTSGLPMSPKGSAEGPLHANAQADRSVDGSPAASVLPANAAESRRPGSSGSIIDVQAEARPAGEQATGKLASRTPADQGGRDSTDLGTTAVSPRDQAPTPVSSPAATPVEHPIGVAADRRSAAGVRLAAALARGARAEGPPGADGASRPSRAAAQATTKVVNSDPQNVSTAGLVDVTAQADRLGERLRTEPLTFGAAVSAVERMPVRVGGAEAVDLRSDVTLSAVPATDIKTSGLAALFATPNSVLGVGASSSHALAAAVAMTAHSALDPAAESDLPRQIVQAMRLQWKDGIGDARIRLLPEYLGELNVAIRVEHGSVTAALEASTPAVRHWIESHEPMLRQSLAEHGLHLDRLIVLDEPEQTGPNQSRERRREKGEEAQQQPPQSRRRPPADDTTFEVIV
jgi:Meckel syndrome type 1 protein